ncbi:hypothetical protein AA309_27655 [Microvirga vignae]|uniref:TRAP transporter small permease protein n=1 Tax=Microvirga vignae TaxID=1225564 RepID=A0A0H1R4T7_9HYPH|nr:TRAP transporter small permease subunit [Microvirga vignae]KLK90084.1 hypothetical protein AA309_27655 [Microvirga vignae]
MLAKLAQLDRITSKVLDWVALAASAFVAGLLVFLVFSRYVLNWSIVGLNELSVLAAMWLYMIGALIASRRREHLVVDLVPQLLSNPWAQAVHRVFVALVTLVITCFFVAWTYQMFAWGVKRPQTIPALGLPLWVSQAAVGVAAVGCCAYALRDVVTGMRALAEAKRASQPLTGRV